MSGYQMQRGWMEHYIFKGEPFTRAMAWEWMIGEAAWKPTKIRMKSMVYAELQRGQFSHSIRFMASKFQWSIGKVHRFIDELKLLGMVGTLKEHEQMIITISNYSKYQLTPNASEQENGTLVERSWNKEEEGKEITTATDINNNGASDDEISSLYVALQEIINAPMPLNMSRVRVWLENGASTQQIIETVTRLMAKRKSDPPSTMNYFEGAVAQTIAESKRPMEQGNARTQNRKSAHDTFGNAWASAASELTGSGGH